MHISVFLLCACTKKSVSESQLKFLKNMLSGVKLISLN